MTRPPVDAKRVAEIRAAWREDRQEQWAAFRTQWPMHLAEIARAACWGFLLGVLLSLSLLIWALESAA